ncbi:MAG: hypothetical protein C0504_19030 [Candidatus Solibacter sp.]|nr:hypothetical protein [Candidatus Solibacter sp.]
MAELREQMQSRGLVVNSRPVSPVIRPHFLSRRQYSNLVKATQTLSSAIARVRDLALSQPALMARMDLLPAEKMLAAVDPGYSAPVAALLDSGLSNNDLQVWGGVGDLPTGVLYGEALADVFLDSGPLKALKKKYKYKLARTGASKPLISAVLKAWKEFGGKTRPRIAILQLRLPFDTVECNESLLLAALLRQSGCHVQVANPEDLNYRDGILSAPNGPIDLIWRNIRAHEFLMHFDLRHALVRAYRDRAVCVVNSFRAELTRKRALLALLTDEQVTAGFPAAERHAIKASVPWTRLVSRSKTYCNGVLVDLPEFILKHRESLVLRPNDGSLDAEAPAYDGASTSDRDWARALRTALGHGYVVQQRGARESASFPIDQYGELVFRDFFVGISAHSFMGKAQGCSTRVAAAGGFSTMAGFAPSFVLESH